MNHEEYIEKAQRTLTLSVSCMIDLWDLEELESSNKRREIAAIAVKSLITELMSKLPISLVQTVLEKLEKNIDDACDASIVGVKK